MGEEFAPTQMSVRSSTSRRRAQGRVDVLASSPKGRRYCAASGCVARARSSARRDRYVRTRPLAELGKDIDATCARLRDVLERTRHLGRREFLAISAARARLGVVARAPRATRLRRGKTRHHAHLWRRLEAGDHHRLWRPVHKAVRHPMQYQEP